MPLRVCFGFVVAVLLAALPGCATRPAPSRPTTLERKVVVGYQGWFRTPDDGAGLGWTHYLLRRGEFAPGNLALDYWPDVSELTPGERAATGFRHADGSPAYVFSSHHPVTVDRHFGWMQEHGIDAAFVQRFTAPIIDDNAPSRRRRAAMDNVLRYAVAGAERHRRGLVVMYDLSGQRQGAMELVKADWRHVVDELKVRASPAYQHHAGKPVVVVWGIGFGDKRAYTLDECADLIRFLKADPVYGGNVVAIGIPTYWREQINDTVPDPRLHDVLRLADILSPWTPGRYYDLGGVRHHAETVWAADKAWCESRGLGYMPVVFPGFSWRNLKQTTGGVDRVEGRFLWEQYRQLAELGCTTIYQAMFDEMDEGTQIFKVTNTPPVGSNVLTYAPLPPDYYLRLVGTAADRIHRGASLPERIPAFRDAPEIARHLRAGDAAIYAAAAESHEAHRRFAEIARTLALQPRGAWAEVGPRGEQVRLAGDWGPRRAGTRDPRAVAEWELPVPAAGDFTVAIRHPGEAGAERATAARVRVWQGEALLLEMTLSLRSEPVRWRELGRVRLAAGTPCRIALDQPEVTGSLPLFEPRLAAAASAPAVTGQ